MKLSSGRVMLALVAGAGRRDQGAECSGLKQQGPPVRVTHMFTLADRQTHFDRVYVKLSRVPGAPATIEKSAPVRVTSCNLVCAAAGPVEGWHRSGARSLRLSAEGVHRAGTDWPG
jgi:hypothetical protein